MREAVGSDNGAGSTGITEYASQQRTGAEQRNSTQNRLTGDKTAYLLSNLTQQYSKHWQGFFFVVNYEN